MTKQPTYEVVTFNLREGVERDAFLASVDAMTAWVRGQPGFLSRDLIEAGDGEWIDVVRWADMNTAKAAAAAAMQAPECGPMMSLIAPTSVQMRHGSLALQSTTAR